MSQTITRDEIQAWEDLVLKPLLKDQLPAEENLNLLGGVAILSADADRIKEYVFESSKLPEIRGASQLLDALNVNGPRDPDENLRKIFARYGFSVELDNQESCIIYAGGGSLLALVPNDLVLTENLKNDIEGLYPRTTLSATISCITRPVSPSDLLAHFSAVMARQALELRRAKEQKNPLPLFEAIPPARRCDSCGLRPASVRLTAPDIRWLCKPCEIKHANSDKQGWINGYIDFLKDPEQSELLNTYLGEYQISDLDLGSQSRIQRARDLNEISQASQDNKSIALIYADGNDIGRQVEASSTLREYRQKSILLQKTMKQAVYKALAVHLRVASGVKRQGSNRRVEDVHIHPFEIITIGGDDALLIIPGDQALNVSITLAEIFQSELSQYPDLFSYPALSVGVAIADSHNPVYFLRILSEDLLKSAKKKANQIARAGIAEGTLDFQILKSQSTIASSVEALRSSYPWLISSRAEQTILTGRPYTLQQARRLLETSQIVRTGVPNTQLQIIISFLRQGLLPSIMNYLYQYARAPEDRKMIYWWVDKQWDLLTETRPWGYLGKRSEHNQFWTVWQDIYEVQDMVARLDEGQWANYRTGIYEEYKREAENAIGN